MGDNAHQFQGQKVNGQGHQMDRWTDDLCGFSTYHLRGGRGQGHIVAASHTACSIYKLV